MSTPNKKMMGRWLTMTVLSMVIIVISVFIVNFAGAAEIEEIDETFRFSVTVDTPGGVSAGGLVHLTYSGGNVATITSGSFRSPIVDCGTPNNTSQQVCSVEIRSTGSDGIFQIEATPDSGSVVSHITTSDAIGDGSKFDGCSPSTVFGNGVVLCTVTIYYTGTGGGSVKSASVTFDTVSIPPSSFNYSLSNGGDKTVTAGSSVTNSITATLISGTSQPVSLSVSGLPAEATASFSPTSVNPTANSTMTINTTSLTSAGTYPIVVTGNATQTALVTGGSCTVDNVGVFGGGYQGTALCEDNLNNLTQINDLFGIVSLSDVNILIDSICANNTSTVRGDISSEEYFVDFTCTPPVSSSQALTRTTSFTLTVTTLPPPTNLTATVGSCTYGATVAPVTLTWTAPNPNNSIGYNIYRNGVYFDSIGSSATSYSTTTPGTAGTSYTYSIKAAYVGAESASATAAPVTVKSCLLACSISTNPPVPSGSYTLNWSSENAVSCAVKKSPPSNTLLFSSLNGSQSYPSLPSSDTTYSISCTGIQAPPTCPSGDDSASAYLAANSCVEPPAPTCTSSTLVSSVTYTITATAGSGGTISPLGSVSVPKGENRTFTITPNAGYTPAITVNSSPATLSLSGGSYTYTFINVQSDKTINATFSSSVASGSLDLKIGKPGDATQNTYSAKKGNKFELSWTNTLDQDDYDCRKFVTDLSGTDSLSSWTTWRDDAVVDQSGNLSSISIPTTATSNDYTFSISCQYIPDLTDPTKRKQDSVNLHILKSTIREI